MYSTFTKYTVVCLFLFSLKFIKKNHDKLGAQTKINWLKIRKQNWVINYFNCVGLQFQNKSILNHRQLRICADNQNLESGCPWDNHSNFLKVARLAKSMI